MLQSVIECGSGFTTKLEGMFKDMDTSKDIMINFKVSVKWTFFGTSYIHANFLALQSNSDDDIS